MIVKRFFEPLLAQASYMIGCGATGEAVVIDANRDVDAYIAAAATDNVRITHVTETHIHADYLSGSRELAARTGAALWLSDEGDADWKYAFADPDTLLHDGDQITVGNVRLVARHTPGHTPEHLTFLVTDGAVADVPIAAVTGDFIFVGDVGRPDLLERAAKVRGTMDASARALFRSLQTFEKHDEWLQIWPGHGAGSACGKGISAVPHSTLGYERRFNWAFKIDDEEEFVRRVLEGQPDPPVYFAMMKRMNKTGPAILGDRTPPHRRDDADLQAIAASGAVIIDTRPASAFAAGAVPGTINIPLNNSFVTWAGWLVPYDADIYLVMRAGEEERLEDATRALSLIGLDRVAGYFAESAVEAVPAAQRAAIPQIEPADLARMRGDHVPVVIDVRTEHEWREGHLPAAVHIPLGRLPERMGELPQGQPLVMQCASGARSSIAASLVQRAGRRDVSNLLGGYNAWTAAGLPTTR